MEVLRDRLRVVSRPGPFGSLWPRSIRAYRSCLPHPAGQAAGWQAQALSLGISGEALLQAERNSLRLLLRRESTPGLGGEFIDGESGGHGVTPIDLS